jgi:hypothetical protein
MSEHAQFVFELTGVGENAFAFGFDSLCDLGGERVGKAEGDKLAGGVSFPVGEMTAGTHAYVFGHRVWLAAVPPAPAILPRR